MTDSQKWLALTFLVLAQFMIVLDVSIMNVALPSIERDLHLNITDLQWIVTAYTLAFGGFLLLGGRTADLYGRKKVFLSGLVAFTTVSFIIGLSTSAALLVPLRALQGLAAAFMSPAALSILLTLFQEQKMRTRALSIWGAVSAGGATMGLLLGGILTTYLTWRWNFFVNIPIGILVFITSLRLLPSHAKEESDRNLDIPGAVLITSGLILTVYTLSKAYTWGWTSVNTLALGATAFFLILAFIWNESRAKHPLMPFSIFKVGNVAAANLIQMPTVASLFSMFFFLSLYVQNILHFTPLQAGLAFLPTSVIIGICATQAPKLIKRFGFKKVLMTTPWLLAWALFIFAHIPLHGSYWSILPGLIIMPIGMGFSFVSITIAATSGVPQRESGLASGLLNTAQQMGGSLGLAILTSVAGAATASAIAGTGGHDPVGQIQALLVGFHSAFYVGICFAISASIFAALFLKEPKNTPPMEQPIFVEA